MEKDSIDDSSGFNDSTKSSNSKLGRPSMPLNEMLGEFTTTKMGKADKDNFAIFIIRAIKKLIKSTLERKPINPVRFAADMSDHELALLYQNCEAVIAKNLENYRYKFDSEFRDIQTQRIFFHDRGIRKIYIMLIKAMFLTSDIRILSRRFNLQCCMSQDHSSLCNEKWESLKVKLIWNFLSEYKDDHCINTLSDEEHLPSDDSWTDTIC